MTLRIQRTTSHVAPLGRSRNRRLVIARAAAGVLLALPLATIALSALGEGVRYPLLLPESFTLRPWLRILDPASGIPSALASSALVAAAVTVGTVILAVPAGYAVARLRGRRRALLVAAFLAPAVAPGFAIAFGLHAAWLRLGLDGGVPGVVIGQLVPATPYAVLIMASAFMRVDPAWVDQARSLGARDRTVALDVLVPLVRPAIAVAAAVAFVIAWGEYVITLLLGGGRVITLPMHVLGLALGGERTMASALMVLYLVPPLAALHAMNVLGGPRPAGRLRRRVSGSDRERRE